MFTVVNSPWLLSHAERSRIALMKGSKEGEFLAEVDTVEIETDGEQGVMMKFESVVRGRDLPGSELEYNRKIMNEARKHQRYHRIRTKFQYSSQYNTRLQRLMS